MNATPTAWPSIFPPPDCSTRKLFNGPGEIVKAELTADASAVPDAVRFFDPAKLILMSLNVATPVVSVGRVVVPESAPVPLDSVIVTATPESRTLLSKASRNRTVIGGVMLVAAVSFDGCWMKASRLAEAEATVSVKVFVTIVARLSASCAVKLYVPANVAVPLMRPDEARVKPDGREPPLNDHV